MLLLRSGRKNPGKNWFERVHLSSRLSQKMGSERRRTDFSISASSTMIGKQKSKQSFAAGRSQENKPPVSPPTKPCSLGQEHNHTSSIRLIYRESSSVALLWAPTVACCYVSPSPPIRPTQQPSPRLFQSSMILPNVEAFERHRSTCPLTRQHRRSRAA